MEKIEAVAAWARPPGAPSPDWPPLASPLSRHGYPAATPHPGVDDPVAVEVRCAGGLSGVGVALGGTPAAVIVEQVLAPLLVGRDAADVAGLWELMAAGIAVYGGAGHAMAALSGIDLALWDLAGKRAGLPVRALIGRDAATAVRCYATCPDAAPCAGAGYVGVKVCLPRGLEADLDEHVAFLAEQRTRVEPETFLAVDCFMALDLDASLALARAVEPLALRWIEEPLAPWEHEALARLRAAGVPTAAGEHDGPAGLRRLLALDAVAVLQPELSWSGGLTDALRLAAAARARGVQLVPHSGGVFACHLAAALRTPAEISLYGSPDPSVPEPAYAALLTGLPELREGRVALGDEPGWGVALRSDLVPAVASGNSASAA